jgi:hypothetical protein
LSAAMAAAATGENDSDAAEDLKRCFSAEEEAWLLMLLLLLLVVLPLRRAYGEGAGGLLLKEADRALLCGERACSVVGVFEEEERFSARGKLKPLVVVELNCG